MKTRSLVAVLGLAAGAALVLENAHADPTLVAITRGPCIQSTSRTSTRITWTTASLTDGVVEFGPGSSLGHVAGNKSAHERDHVVTLDGLEAGKTYSYRIVTGGQTATPTLTFATAPAPGTAFTALVFGDSGTGTANQWNLAKRMQKESFDLVLHVGDLVYTTGDDALYEPRFFAPYREILKSHPFFPTPGNHDLDQTGGWPYRRAFALPANNPQKSELYYSFDWGDVHFVSLDTNGTFRHQGPATTWLANDLATTTKRWKVVFMHQPLYSIGHHGDQVEVQGAIGPILENARVDLVLAGHDHDYERSAPIKRFSKDPTYAGIPYVVTGGGGASLYKDVHPRKTTKRWDVSHHYVLLTFGPDAIQGRAVRLDGSTIEKFSLSK